MNPQQEALNRLKDYRRIFAARRNLKSELRRLKQGTERQEVMEALNKTRQWLRVTDRALDTLPEREQLVLRQLFCRELPQPVEEVCRQLGVEKSSVYRWRTRALKHLAQALYGPIPREEEINEK